MRTKDVSRTLVAYAQFAELGRSEELYLFSAFLEQGRGETIYARLKTCQAPKGYPARLKESLEAIRSILLSAGAKKQAAAFSAMLKVFTGRPGLSVDDFLTSISTPPPAPNLALPRYRAASLEQADEFVDRLNSSVLDTRAIRDVVMQLSSPRRVGTATLLLVANKFLENTCTYRDRKTALKAITRGLSEKSLPNLVREQNAAKDSKPA
jgi:hypothetical protein